MGFLKYFYNLYMTKKSKSYNTYNNVKKKKYKKSKTFNNCRELLKKENIIKFDIINPLIIQYYKEKNIKIKVDDKEKEMNNVKNKFSKFNEIIKKELDKKKEITNDTKDIIVYKPPDTSKFTKNQKPYVNLRDFLEKINKQGVSSKCINSNEIFKPKLIIKPRNRYHKRRLQYKNKWDNINTKIPPPPPKIVKEKVNIEREINNIEELLQLINDYPIKPTVEYNINMNAIHNIKEPLTELNSMIGMHKLKENVVDQILYFIQELHKISNSNTSDFMHTVIYGPPGTGKTETAKIMGKIFSGLGVLKQNKFRKVTRADLIAGYLGQTALKTQDVIKSCLGGVLFIDEAYALGNIEKRDSFAKECIDTLCEGLSDHKDDLMVIIAGYKVELEKCFFAYNSGLTSRFTWRFKTDDYNYKELFLIFKKKVSDINWKLHENIKECWFENKKDDFKYYGRDIETFLSKAKICHSKRVFCLPKERKTILTKKDLDKAFVLFKDNSTTDEDIKIKKDILHHMYV